MSRHRCYLPILAALAAGALHAQTPDAPPPSDKPKYAALENEQAMYSPLESSWADLKTNHTLETHLFNLLRAEVRLWTLQNQLAAQPDSPVRENADEISRIIHAQVLGEAAEALPLLQRNSNRPFALLLVHQLEAYPYEWREEGSEELLPSLHKLADPPTDKPTPDPGEHRRRRQHASNDDG